MRFLKILFATLLFGATAAAEDDLLKTLGVEGEPEVKIEQSKEIEFPVLGQKLLPKLSGEQNIFFQMFDRQEFEKALFQWPAAFSGTAFETSSDGHALYGLLLVRNKLPIFGLQRLMAAPQPEKIHPELITQWKVAVPSTSPYWKYVGNHWKDSFAKVFGIRAEVLAKTRSFNDPDNFAMVEEMIKKTEPGTWERAWLQWQLTLAYALKDQVAKAAQTLAHLMKVPENPVGQDLMNVTAARLLYQNGFLNQAVDYYKKVPRASDYWFDAQEEIAWSYVRKGEPQNALAVLKSVNQPAFYPLTSPEAQLVESLTLLKVCDYPKVAESLVRFKNVYKPRAQKLTALTKTSDSEAIKKFMEKQKDSRKTLLEMGPVAAELPRLVTRDEILLTLVEVYHGYQTEAKTIEDLHGRSLTTEAATVGYQGWMEKLRNEARQRQANARDAIVGRIQKLAQDELGEIKYSLDKLHVVEAELLQQVSNAERAIAASPKKMNEKKGTTTVASRDSLVFPYNGEVWFDELSHYQVDLKKGCQAKAN